MPVLDKETLKQSFVYTAQKLKQFDEEASAFMRTNQSLFTTYPSYELLIKNCFSMSEYYKKSQAMAKVGKNLFDAVRKFQGSDQKLYELASDPQLKDVAENAEKLASRCGGMVKLFSTLFTQGRQWDEAVGEKGKVLTLGELQERNGAALLPVKTIDEYTEETRTSLTR